jgi:hypothetical protein
LRSDAEVCDNNLPIQNQNLPKLKSLQISEPKWERARRGPYPKGFGTDFHGYWVIGIHTLLCNHRKSPLWRQVRWDYNPNGVKSTSSDNSRGLTFSSVPFYYRCACYSQNQSCHKYWNPIGAYELKICQDFLSV